MNDLHLSCVFYQAASIDLARVQDIAARVMRRGFEFKRVTANDKLAVVRNESGLPELFRAHLTTSESKKGHTEWSVAFPAYPTGFPDLIGDFEFYEFGPQSHRMALSALIDFELVNQKKYVKPCEELWSKLAQDLRPKMQLDYGFIDDISRNSTQRKDVEKSRLSVIGWQNFWGPSYVEKYGKRTLLGMPGMTTRELPDGGIFHQLSPRLVTSDKKSAGDLRKRVTEYCAKNELKVKCFAPYFLSET